MASSQTVLSVDPEAGTFTLRADELRRGDLIADGGRIGRYVRKVTVRDDSVKVLWLDGWHDVYSHETLFDVRSRDNKHIFS